MSFHVLYLYYTSAGFRKNNKFGPLKSIRLLKTPVRLSAGLLDDHYDFQTGPNPALPNAQLNEKFVCTETEM